MGPICKTFLLTERCILSSMIVFELEHIFLTTRKQINVFKIEVNFLKIDVLKPDLLLKNLWLLSFLVHMQMLDADVVHINSRMPTTGFSWAQAALQKAPRCPERWQGKWHSILSCRPCWHREGVGLLEQDTHRRSPQWGGEREFCPGASLGLACFYL